MLNKKITVTILAISIVYLLIGCNNSKTVIIEPSAEKFSVANELNKISHSMGVDQKSSILAGLYITTSEGIVDSIQLTLLVPQGKHRIEEYIVHGGDGKSTIRKNKKVRTNPNNFSLTLHDFVTAIGELRLSDLHESTEIGDIRIQLERAMVGERLVTTNKQTISKIVSGKIIKIKLNEQLVVASPSSKFLIMDGYSLRIFLIGNSATEALSR